MGTIRAAEVDFGSPAAWPIRPRRGPGTIQASGGAPPFALPRQRSVGGRERLSDAVQVAPLVSVLENEAGGHDKVLTLLSHVKYVYGRQTMDNLTSEVAKYRERYSRPRM